MSHLSGDWEFGFAMVTSEGVKHGGRTYTNLSMVKNKWFELALNQGAWRIPILYSEQYNDAIIILDLTTSCDVAVSVSTDKLPEEDLDHYFKKIICLKEKRKELNK